MQLTGEGKYAPSVPRYKSRVDARPYIRGAYVEKCVVMLLEMPVLDVGSVTRTWSFLCSCLDLARHAALCKSWDTILVEDDQVFCLC